MRPAQAVPRQALAIDGLLVGMVENAPGRPDFPLRYIPNYRLGDQKGDLWCWAAMGESIARYYDENSGWTQCRIANRLRHPGEQGTDCCAGGRHQCNWMRAMDDVFDAIGHFRAPRRGPIPFDDICREIEQRRPVCVRITPQGNGHFVAITGVARVAGVDWIWVNDPVRRDGRVPFDQFHRLYDNSWNLWTHTYLTRREGGIGWA